MSVSEVAAGCAPVLEVRNLTVAFPARLRGAPTTVVKDVSFKVGANETVGLVGESGSGKTTIARVVLGLTPVSKGSVLFNGEDITRAGRRQRRALSSAMQVVFQDPYSSLSPTRTILQTLAEPVLAQGTLRPEQARSRAVELLERVGLDRDALVKYPRQFSGGQRQRIAIARALMLRPQLVVLDEPVSALDLSVQAQVLNLLRELQREYGLSFLFIAHNLAVVRYMASKLLVLYRGHLMEAGDSETIYAKPANPYTKALLDAAPVADPQLQAQRRVKVVAVPASSVDPDATGCVFRCRCAYEVEACAAAEPSLTTLPNGTNVACHRAGSFLASAEGNTAVGTRG